MSLEQQIQACESNINYLEQLKRLMVSNEGGLRQSDESQIPELDLNRINKSLDEYYQQIAILKIRQMMGY